MKKALKYIAISVVSLLVLLSVLPLCIYIPAIQQWGKNEICNYVERSTGMHLTLGRLALKFPFKLQINDILLLATQQDTLLQSAQIQVGVAPAALLKGNVQINQIALQETRFNFTSADSTLSLSARIKEFSTRNATLHLKDSRIVLPDSRLDSGDIVLKLSESPTDTTEESEPLPWKISAGSIVLSNIHYAMQMQPTIESLDASIGEASLRQGDIDLYRQKVDVAEFLIEQGDYRYYPGSGEPDNGNDTSNTTTPPDSIVSPPWTIQVKQIRLLHNSLLYALPVQVPQKGFDPGYIALNNIEIAIDSFYNCGSTITVPIKQLAFIERSGLAVQHTRGLFSMDSTGIALTDFQLKTMLSEISAQIHVGEGIFAQEPQTPVEAQLNARIAVGDIITALPEYTPYTRGLLLSSGLVSEFSASGQLGDLSLQKGELSFPGIFSLHTTGKVINLPNTDKLGGTLAWEMKVPESPLIARLLPDSLQERIHIPATRFSGKARLSEAFIQAQVLVEAGQGNIGLQARLNTQKEIYAGALKIDQFPLSLFLPHDSLGILSASARFSGYKYNPVDSTAHAIAELNLEEAHYNGYRYSGISVDANLNRGKLNGNITSSDPNLTTHIALQADLSPDNYTAQLTGHLRASLGALHLTTETCDIATAIALSASANPAAESYRANLALDSLSVLLPTSKLQSVSFTASAETDSTRLNATLQSGDLAIKFTSSIGLNAFLECMDRSMPILASVQEEKRLDMTALHHALPPFEFSINAQRNNLIQQYLKGMDMGFSQLNLQVGNDSLLNSTGEIDRLSAGGIAIDTIQLSLFEKHEQEERLYYALHIGNKPGNLDQLASVGLNGFLSDNTTKLFCVQKNRQGQEGFRIGCQANFLDSLVQVSFFPKNPIIGFETWTLNPDNFFAYYYGGHFDANIALTYNERHFIITTLHNEATHNLTRQEPLKVDINGMEIAPWLALSPFAPQIAGSISANLLVNFPQNGTEVEGSMGIAELYYGKQRVGDLDLNVNYRLDSLNRQEAKAGLEIDNQQVLALSGLLDNQAEKPILLDLAIERFPLTTANPFLPADMAQLQGFLNGQMSITGSTEAPLLNGYIQMAEASVNSSSMGASLNFPPDSIRVNDNVLQFENYAITGTNKNPLNIDGSIDFKNTHKIMTDLRLLASEFQPVKSARSTKATVYGSVIADMDMKVNGPLDALKVRGNVGLLTGTEVTYVMQDSPFALQQQENNIVTFVSFNDSTEIAEDDTLTTASVLGMDILVNINIAPTVKMGVNLSVDGKNRIDLQGGGELTYTMNTLGDSRFTGRYTLSGGFVRYNPPVISEKLFKIQDGSYVSWNGNIADPQLSITAVQTVRTTIAEEDKNSRQVNFNISIIIKNSLEDLSVAFDLSAPEDLTLQNQLASLTAEQRASQAMSLLIYNTYTGPGTSTTKADLMGNPLNSFLQKELNEWANNLKGIDLSFDINSYTDASGVNTRTDYSYRAAKSLFNNRVKVVIGGSLSPDDNADVNFKENFIDDISLEYYLNQRDNMYIKVFRHSGYESILEGEITQTGVGFVVKKRLLNLSELFRSSKKRKESAQ